MKISRFKNLIGVFIILIGISWMYYLYASLSFSYTMYLKYHNPRTTTFMRDYDGDKPIQHKWVPIDKISLYLQQAVVLAEDDRFYSHSGFDWEAIKDAFEINWRRKSLARGGSTITQQVAKNLYLSPSKNPIRKIKEFMLAIKLERELSKKRILEIYLNVVEWGEGIYGAEAAARHYFNTTAANLGKHEAAFLAAILPKPRYYDKHRNGGHLSQRVASIESRL